jgi:hypothetical protein
LEDVRGVGEGVNDQEDYKEIEEENDVYPE